MAAPTPVSALLHAATIIIDHQGEWFNGKTAAFKVADLGSNPCSPAEYFTWDPSKI